MEERDHIIRDGRTIEFVVSGDPDGIPVLFIAGSFSTPVAWRAIQAALGPGYCCYATSILGYGRTEETRTAADCGISHEIDVIAALGQHIGRPVHLVGHSFGGTVALGAVMKGGIEAISLATFEANPIAILEASHSELFAEALATGDAIRQAWQTGDDDAPAVVIDYWGGAGSFAELPEAVRQYCRATTFANVLDWQTVLSLSPSGDALNAVDSPVLLVRGADANPAMVEITRLLEVALPRATAATVAGASHFLISTHPSECARLLADFYATA